MRRVAFLLCVFVVMAGGVRGQTAPPAGDETQQKLKALEERILALEAELRAMRTAAVSESKAGGTPAVPAAGTPVAASPQAPVQLGGAGAAAAKVLNPDISVIGNFLGAAGVNNVRGVPALEMAETEVGYQAIIDPYARADVFLSFGESGVDVEEGYLTFTSLPGGLLAKVGKMRAAFGKANMLHSHNLPWTDRPLVTENLVNGEEGISDAGLAISRILPAPKGIFLEATGQVYRGDSGDLFVSNKKDDVSVVGHMRGYGDISESTNLDLGFSYARGHNSLGSQFITNLYGVDATLRWKPLRRAIYNSFIWRNEFVWGRSDQTASLEKPFGLYSSAEYRVNRRWTLGGRFDRSGRLVNAAQTDTGFSALLTYWPSEFSQIRGQYRFTRYAEGMNGNELRFQFLFVLGAHGAHPF